MSDWWADPVKEIYADALALLGGDDDPLEYGQGYVVWCDGNFEDVNVDFCIKWGVAHQSDLISRYGGMALAVAQQSLLLLREIPERDRITSG